MGGFTAASNVLNTNELLEGILKHIPPKELLHSTRFVSRNWKAIIESSPKLQWKTWQWKGTNIPPSVLEEPDLFSDNGRKYGYEFAADAVYWLREFWYMVLTVPRNSSSKYDGDDGLPPDMREWMINRLPDMELFRPRLEGVHVSFELSWIIHGINLSLDTSGNSEVNVANGEFKLRDFARIIYEKALSSQGLGLFQYAWERHGAGKGRWVKKVQRKFKLHVTVSTGDPKRLDHAIGATTGPTKYSVGGAFVFDMGTPEWSPDRGVKVGIEYRLPGQTKCEAREELRDC
ncbi:hypothetical protein TWF481_001082 [Arthrobotrys musiformis]|uniref:F-box domain-containing protein n=1 Tax=Arthrobotrys musiformis TaxID=47236 RepID=A0AAV9WVL1_9PEZI